MANTLKEELIFNPSLRPAARTTTISGASFLVTPALVFINGGMISGTNPSFTFQIQSSDDDQTFGLVDQRFLHDGLAEVTITESFRSFHTDYVGPKTFLRVSITAVSGLTPSLGCSATIIEKETRNLPQTDN